MKFSANFRFTQHLRVNFNSTTAFVKNEHTTNEFRTSSSMKRRLLGGKLLAHNSIPSSLISVTSSSFYESSSEIFFINIPMSLYAHLSIHDYPWKTKTTYLLTFLLTYLQKPGNFRSYIFDLSSSSEKNVVVDIRAFIKLSLLRNIRLRFIATKTQSVSVYLKFFALLNG